MFVQNRLVKIVSATLIICIPYSLSASSKTIGTVYGEQKWIAYIGSGNSIFIKRGSTGFKNVCDTGLVSKNDYVISPSGSTFRTKKQVLTEIQRRLIRGKIKGGCK